MEDLLSKLDKIKKIEDPRIRQALSSKTAEKSIFGQGGMPGFLGTQDLPPEAYGTEYTNLPDPYRKAIEEVADMDLKKLRTTSGQQALTKALAKQNVPPQDAASFVKSTREAAEVWLGKDTREFMKKVGGLESSKQAPSKVGHIADLLKTNKQGVSKASTLWRFLKAGMKGGAKGYSTAAKIGTGALIGGAIVKLLQHGFEEERPTRTFRAVEETPGRPALPPSEVKSLDDIRKALDEL